MLFNSLEFVLFLIIVYFTYWKLTHKYQNIFLLFCSYFFYGWWDWRFLGLIIISSVVDYIAGIKISSTEKKSHRKLFLLLSIFTNLGILGLFKYFNFFVDSLQNLFTSIGIPSSSLGTLNIILPVGISFYTFQTMSYTFEVYQGKVKSTRDIVQFFCYVSFFPQLVAGPIERAINLLGQFAKEREFNMEYATDGCRQMLWGFFKKIVIADSLASVVNRYYADPVSSSGGELLIATIFFAFQIYCDFSGYSDIAIGCARLFGFKIMRNFAYPYFSRNIQEFWHRWHISLSTWFRDYVFFTLGGSKVRSKLTHIRNVLITFTTSGLWHGANFTFIVWGFLHGLFYIPHIFIGKSRDKKSYEPSLRDIHKIIFTFIFVLLTWVFFRASSINEAIYIIQKIILEIPQINLSMLYPKRFLLIFILIFFEWLNRTHPHPLFVDRYPKLVRYSFYYLLVGVILFAGDFNYIPFIYFQF